MVLFLNGVNLKKAATRISGGVKNVQVAQVKLQKGAEARRKREAARLRQAEIQRLRAKLR